MVLDTQAARMSGGQGRGWCARLGLGNLAGRQDGCASPITKDNVFGTLTRLIVRYVCPFSHAPLFPKPTEDRVYKARYPRNKRGYEDFDGVNILRRLCFQVLSPGQNVNASAVP
jgi:hypothetical protein